VSVALDQVHQPVAAVDAAAGGGRDPGLDVGDRLQQLDRHLELAGGVGEGGLQRRGSLLDSRRGGELVSAPGEQHQQRDDDQLQG